MMESCPDGFIALAHEMADAARGVIMRHFRQKIPIDVKPDASPVTVADRGAEEVMRDLIRARFPDHGILGEEFGAEKTDAEFVWVLDPIDGTKAFITGIPVFTTLIAVTRGGLPLFGMADQAVLRERFTGGKGLVSSLNGAPIQTRACADPKKAMNFTTGLEYYTPENRAYFDKLDAQVGLTRMGTDAYGFCMVAAGFGDCVIESGVNAYDVLALAPIIEGAGGIMTGWRGEPVTIETDGRVLGCGDPVLHAKLLPLLS